MAAHGHRYDQLAESQGPKPTGLRKTSTRLPVSNNGSRSHAGSHNPPFDAPPEANLTSSKTQQLPKTALPPSRTTTVSPLPSTSNIPPGAPRARASLEKSSLPRQIATSPIQLLPSSRIRTSNKTPSLVSGSTLTGPDSSRSPLRRKPSTIDKYVARTRTDPEILQEDQELLGTTRKPSHIDDPFPGAIFGISLPPASVFPSNTIKDYISAEDATRTADFARKTQGSRLHTLQPALPLHDISATSSSRYSGSPFSHISTPTSASSYASHMLKGDKINSPEGSNQRSAITERRTSKGEFRDTEASPRTPMGQTPRRPSADIQERSRQMPARKPVPLPKDSSRRNVSEKAPPPSLDTEKTKVRSRPQNVRIPPELAHLNVDLPAAQSLPKAFPPRRPSREGIAELTDWRGNLTVVESNLPASYNSYNRRTPSSETPVSAKSPSSPGARKLFGFSSRSSSRQGSPRVDSAVSSSPLMRSLSGQVDIGFGEVRARTQPEDSPKAEAIESPVKTSRLGFFSRRPKEGAEKLERPERKPKRGPAAGTGHEGYGRFGFRGRNGSFFGNTGRSPSSDSNKSSRSASPFRRRKNTTDSDDESVVKTSVEEMRSPTLLRGYSSHSSLLPSGSGKEPSVDNPAKSPRHGPLASPFISTAKSSSFLDRPSYDDDIDVPLSPRSTRRINTGTFVDGKEGHWLRSVKSTPHAGPQKHSNFSQRVRAINTDKMEVDRGLVLPTTSTTASPSRDLAHYALAGSSKAVELKELGRLVTENSQPSIRPTARADSHVERQPVVPFERRHESFLPSPPALSQSSPRPKAALRTDSSESPQLLQAQTAMPARPPHLVDISKASTQQRLSSISMPRLSAVGRIPPVVSRRDQDRKLPSQSFSRPFAQAQPRPTLTQKDLAMSIERASSIKRQPSTPYLPSVRIEPTASNTTGAGSKRADLQISTFGHTKPSKDDFLAFPERKNSDLSYTSSSGIASPCCNTSRESFYHGEEEVWNEYNDLLSEVMPVKTPVSAGSSMGAPFQYAEMSLEKSRESAVVGNQRTLPDLMEQPEDVRPASFLLTDTDEIPPRFSQFLQPAHTPSTPFSISDYLVGYGDRTSKASESALRYSAPDASDKTKKETPRLSLPASRRQEPLETSTIVPMSESTDADARYATSIDSAPQSPPLADVVKPTRAQAAAVTGELRFAALMTSKWLSFGRVLFSPAHGEAKTGEDSRVLILDGLGKGNQTSPLCSPSTADRITEWSYYCALTYPDCQIYNLGTETSTASRRSVPNHRHIPHPSLAAPFPFPSGFFTAVVFRFPLATYGSAYQAAITECRRVLRPGGYLEVSVLDLDLMNMGTRARKAVKELKIRIHRADNQISLRNMGDVAMRLLGTGFDNIQRCVVGLPVAGRIPRSQDLSSTTSIASQKQPTSTAAADTSFADLLQSKADETGQHDYNDEGITKMVAKVGRWWYSTCYEEPFAATNDENEDHESMWDTPGLLRECEKQGTSLRLLICYAQKPTCPKRRTASV